MKYGTAAGRRGFVLDRLRMEGFAVTAVLARDMGVSEMTVRRDLSQLRDEGAVILVRGGASLPMGARLSSFASRQAVNADAKRRMAERAVRRVRATDAIALDAGTTAQALAEALPADFSGAVVTPSIPIVHFLMDRSSCRVIALGGEVHGASRACIGPTAVEGARRLRVRTFFLGAAAVDRHGVYVEADLERPTKLAMMEMADQVVLVADRSKFERFAPVLLCPFDSIASLITDGEPPTALRKELTRRKVDIETE